MMLRTYPYGINTGLLMMFFQLSDYEPAFKALAIAANWVVVKGNLLTGAMADLKTGVDPITVTTNVEGYFVMSLDIADITLYDGFFINAPDAEVAWYLYNIPSLPSDAFDYVCTGAVSRDTHRKPREVITWSDTEN
jgi:hypothetical protein